MRHHYHPRPLLYLSQLELANVLGDFTLLRIIIFVLLFLPTRYFRRSVDSNISAIEVTVALCDATSQRRAVQPVVCESGVLAFPTVSD